MLITYKNHRFPALIKEGIKVHTIREDRTSRWKVGMRIDHWMHNPRHITMNPYSFCMGMHRLISKQDIIIEPNKKIVRVDGRLLNDKETAELAYNDGLINSRGLYKWFNEPFSGYILHWTNKKD